MEAAVSSITRQPISPIPGQAPPQHMVALARANKVRTGHAALKRDIAAGRITVIEGISDPRAVGSFYVKDLLTAQRRWGRVRARKLLHTINIAERKRVDTLTDRQRKLLATSLASG